MKISQFSSVLLLALGLAFTGPTAQAADKKHHKDDKDSSHHVVTRDHSPPSRSSHAPSRSTHNVASSSHSSHSPSSHKSAPVQRTRTPQSPIVAHHSSSSSSHSSNSHKSAPVQRTRTPQSPIVAHHSNSSSSHSSRDSDHHSQPSRQVVTSHSQVTRGHSSTHHDSGPSAITRQQLAASRSSVATRDRSPDLRNFSSAHSSPSHHPIVTRQSDTSHHRDRSHYVQRHEHHSGDWYRSNGWVYDRDYYEHHHVHRYCNDRTGTFIIEYNAPYYLSSPYDYGYSNPTPYYYGGVDYETRVAVQEALADAGYYDGPIDGIIGSGSQSAIASYQYDYGLPVTGRIDDSLIQSLGLYY